MLDTLLRNLVQCTLWLRYRVRVRGLERIARGGTRGILFLPNHPALIDPVIMMATLHRRFAPRALADADQINRPVIRWVARRSGTRPIPDVRTHGPAARAKIEAVLRDCAEGLRRGENLLLYPSGHIYRTRCEDLRGNSAVQAILAHAPDARVVLVRTRGLWGSGFSLARGHFPNLGRDLLRYLRCMLANFLFFTPRREVTIEFVEPEDLPRGADRDTLNAYMERFYNEDAPPSTYVPYTIWERGRPRPMPEPDFGHVAGDPSSVPESTRALVTAYLCELAGVDAVRDEQRLAADLGLDSLAKIELVLWLQREFGFGEGDVDAVHTVGDVLLAARGEAVVSRPVELRPVPRAWFADRGRERLRIAEGSTIAAAFLAQARQGAGRAAVADQLAGVRSYRDLVTAVFVLKPLFEALPGERLGIMLPASVAACVAYLAALFARKTPVMVNWTTGTRNIAHALGLTGVQRIITAGPLVSRIQSQGTDLSAIADRFVRIEDLARGVSRGRKLLALARSWLSWSALDHVNVPDTAVVLLTSGSESQPKAVPLSHTNLLSNMRDMGQTYHVRADDCLIGFLPPFHSFGLTVTMLLPLLAGARVVYHPNPTEAWVLARLIEAYKVTMICGTPTFLSGIIRASKNEQLASLRLAVTGAEKCLPHVYAALAQRCPNATICEGYGVSECSPVVAANRVEDTRPGTIGRLLPSFEHAIVDVETGDPVSAGQVGMLLVRGPSVFSGYLGDDVASPFVEHAGKSWYRTGDLVSADADGVLTFRGRLKRFVKLGGEMISLPAIEAALEPHYVRDDDEGPVIAVQATPNEDHPELVLFTTRPASRAAANQQIRAAGLSPLHNISRVVTLESIPVLGTGKTDYRALAAMLRESQGC